jgi:hypothetical protein
MCRHPAMEGLTMNTAQRSQRLSAPDAARYCGILPSTLAKLRVYGSSPRYPKLCRRVVYDTAVWLAAHRRCSTFECDSEGGVSCTR